MLGATLAVKGHRLAQPWPSKATPSLALPAMGEGNFGFLCLKKKGPALSRGAFPANQI
jgi:hypothetical protein